jgi:hypothetical protein
MDAQIFINLAIGIAGVFGGWILNRIWVAMDRLDHDVRKMPEKYVFKEDYRRDVTELKDICNKIFERLEAKQDKP